MIKVETEASALWQKPSVPATPATRDEPLPPRRYTRAVKTVGSRKGIAKHAPWAELDTRRKGPVGERPC